MTRPAVTLRHPIVAAIAAAGLLLAAGCSEDDSSVPTVPGATAAVTQATSVKIAPEEGAALIESMGASLTIIDVRTPEEFAAGHIEGAININLEGGSFSTDIAALDPAASYLVYCQSGRRSGLAAETMVAAGFTEVHDVGGIADWVAAGFPIVTT